MSSDEVSEWDKSSSNGRRQLPTYITVCTSMHTHLDQPHSSPTVFVATTMGSTFGRWARLSKSQTALHVMKY